MPREHHDRLEPSFSACLAGLILSGGDEHGHPLRKTNAI
jgi:hypothetical protein